MPLIRQIRSHSMRAAVFAFAVSLAAAFASPLAAQQAVSGNAPPMSRDSMDTRVRLRIAQIV